MNEAAIYLADAERMQDQLEKLASVSDDAVVMFKCAGCQRYYIPMDDKDDDIGNRICYGHQGMASFARQELERIKLESIEKAREHELNTAAAV